MLPAMDSLDAQCLLIQVTMGHQRPPDLWRHDRSGALSCAYEDGTTTFTWPAKDVAEMARKWRGRDPGETPRPALDLRDAHERLSAMADEGGLPAADIVIHDLPRAELKAIWEEQKVVLVVQRIGEAAGTDA
jgi:hypothetical protein